MPRTGRDRLGEKYGHLTVTGKIVPKGGGRTLWNFSCSNCGNTEYIADGAVTERLVRLYGTASCGCLRTKHGGYSKHNPAHIRDMWRNMHARCYDPSNHSYRFYGAKGVSVATCWHDFKPFMAWVLEHYPRDGRKYQLDKDLRGKGHKVYSPETCQFVPAQVNVEAALAKEYWFLSPEGNITRVYNLQKFCRNNGLTQANMHKVFTGERKHHKGWQKHAPKI